MNRLNIIYKLSNILLKKDSNLYSLKISTILFEFIGADRTEYRRLKKFVGEFMGLSVPD